MLLVVYSMAYMWNFTGTFVLVYFFYWL